MKRNRYLNFLLAATIVSVGLVAYWPVFGYNFFWEDPFDIGQVEGHSLAQLLLLPNSNSYYRPLSLIWARLSLGGGLGYSPLPFHLAVVSGHLVAAALCFGLVNSLLRDRPASFAAGMLFVLYPVAFEGTARVYSQHPIFAAVTIAVLWLYLLGREQNRRWLMGASLGLGALAVFFHENGVLLPPMVMALELYLLWQKRIPRFSRSAFLFLIPAGLFVILWLNIPKSVAPPQFGLHPLEALYLSQGLSFPLARGISQFGGLGLTPEWQAGIAVAATLALLLFCLDRKWWPTLLLALTWWGLALSLAWAARPIDYLVVSPRVMYFGSLGASLAWTGLVAGSQNKLRRLIGWMAVIVIALQSWTTLRQEVTLYGAGSKLMDQIVAVGRSGGRLLFLNIPDRFEYRQPLYPLGYWGMLLAPVSQELSDFVRFATGVQMQTGSLSDFPLMAAMVEASPYRVNTRGSDGHASDVLYEKIVWADEVYWTEYYPSGAMTLKAVGGVSREQPPVKSVGRFGEVAEALSAESNWASDSPQVTLRWHSLAGADVQDTVFVHVFDSNGALVGQGDGDSLNGLLPLSAWRPGDVITDRRTIVSDGPLPPGEYRVTIGIYNRVTGERYPAFEANGRPVADGELEVLKVMK